MKVRKAPLAFILVNSPTRHARSPDLQAWRPTPFSMAIGNLGSKAALRRRFLRALRKGIDILASQRYPIESYGGYRPDHPAESGKPGKMVAFLKQLRSAIRRVLCVRNNTSLCPPGESDLPSIGIIFAAGVWSMSPSASSNLNFRVKPLQFDAGLSDSELPVDGSLLDVRPSGPGGDFRLQGHDVADGAVRQASAGHANQFAFRHVEPTAVLGGVDES